MNYIECVFNKTSGSLDTQISIDILVAELGEIGFESFTENLNGVTAYIQVPHWDPKSLENIQILKSSEVKFDVKVKEIEQVNWNEEWEKNFEPIVVDDQVSIRAPFHENPDLPYDIVIEPKMSFGTGHHETTHLMIQHLMQTDLRGKVGARYGLWNRHLGNFCRNERCERHRCYRYRPLVLREFQSRMWSEINARVLRFMKEMPVF